MISNARNRKSSWGEKKERKKDIHLGKNPLLENINVRRRQGKSENHVLVVNLEHKKS